MHPKVSLPPAPDAGPDRYTKRCAAALGFSLVCKIEYPDFVVLELLDTLLSDLYILWIVVMGSDTWVKAYAINDCLGIQALDFGVCIQFIEIAYS